MTLEALLDRLERRAGTPRNTRNGAGVPLPRTAKPAETQRKTARGTPGTRGTPDSDKSQAPLGSRPFAVEPETPPEPDPASLTVNALAVVEWRAERSVGRSAMTRDAATQAVLHEPGTRGCIYCDAAVCRWSGEPSIVFDDHAQAHGACFDRWLRRRPEEFVEPMFAEARAADIDLSLGDDGGLVIAAPVGTDPELIAELRDWDWAVLASLRRRP